MVKKALGVIPCFLLAACTSVEKKIIRGSTPGIEYHNQTTAPWPWVSVVPSERTLAMKEVEFESISQQIHFDIAFDPHSKTFKNVRTISVDYTILPEEKAEDHSRPERYFMVMSFYKIGKIPPCPPDFEITATLRTDKAGKQEAMRYLARDIIEEIFTLSDDGLLTPGKKITVNLD